MAAFIAKQPNGLYCRFSHVVGCPTHWNLTAEDYIELCKQEAEEFAKNVLEHSVVPFDRVKESTAFYEMTEEQFQQFLKEVGDSDA